MSRKRWVQIDGELVEVSQDYVGESRHHGRVHGDLHYDGLRASDGTPIDTRTKHREYMKRHNLTTADDFKGAWQRAAKERAEFFTTGKDRSRREDVARAIHQITEGNRGRRH